MNIWIFIISAIGVTVLLIGINYQSMYDYATYTVPMKNAVLDEVGHYDYLPLNKNPNLYSMEKIVLADNNEILVKFGQNNILWNPSGYKPIPEFTYEHNFKINDVFVVLCTNIGKDGYADQFPDVSNPYLPGLGIVKYLGVYEVEGEKLLLFWHESASVQVDMQCDYPEIISHSINLWNIHEQGKPIDKLEQYFGSDYPNFKNNT